MSQSVPVVILAGGRGTRLMEETTVRPKPMVEIGGQPILWHVMNIYAQHGHRDFIVALGYKGDVIKQYFLNLPHLSSDFEINLRTGATSVAQRTAPDWRVRLADTGEHTQTGGRILRLAAHLHGRTFMLTYGDGVGDVDIAALLAFHRSHGKCVTLTAMRPPSRFGALEITDKGQVVDFSEKPQTGEGWINGGFFVVEPAALAYLDDDDTIWERGPMERLAQEGQLMAYQHPGFWQPMDTIRDRLYLESVWNAGQAPWHRVQHPAVAA